MARPRGRPLHPDVLTPAEWSTLHLLRHGLSNRRIARLRGTSLDAVRFHLSNIRLKIGMASRRELRQWGGQPADSAIATKEATMAGDDLRLGVIGQIALTVSSI